MRDNSIDQVIPRTLIAKIDFEAIVEEGQQVVSHRGRSGVFRGAEAAFKIADNQFVDDVVIDIAAVRRIAGCESLETLDRVPYARLHQNRHALPRTGGRNGIRRSFSKMMRMTPSAARLSA